MTVYVRQYESSDAQRCCDIINDAIEAIDGLNDEARAHVRASNVPERLGSDLERWITLVVESDDGVVGVGALDGDEVKRVYVDPAAHGVGAATALMRALEEIASHRLGTIQLDASPTSVGFYESLGYVPIAEDRLNIGAASFRFVRMTKDISFGNHSST